MKKEREKLNNRMFVDQHGVAIAANSVKDLASKAGGGRVGKVFVDKKDGTTKHVGYYVGRRWFHEFTSVERDVNF